MRLEVRCCCDAGKLLGYVDVPAPLVFRGARVKFALRRHPPIVLEIGELFNYGPGSLFFMGDPTEKLAVKSMDTPIEMLREIPGFEEF